MTITKQKPQKLRVDLRYYKDQPINLYFFETNESIDPIQDS